MKKQILFLVATLSTLFTIQTASAQGEWKWANYWSGGGSANTNNLIIQTAFDDEGDIYVFGQIGGNSTLNGQLLQFTNDSYAFNINKLSSLLAKFDTLGNMLWYKIVKSSGRSESPHWMEVKDNKVFISGEISLDYVDNPASVSSVWLYYFDTLITGPQVHEIPVGQRRPPYKTGRYTYFATFDLDGNLLDNHFVETRTRKIYANGVRGEYGLCAHNPYLFAPFHVDIEGNTYVFTRLEYEGFVKDPYTIIVDGDTSRTYDVYLPGDVDTYGQHLENGMMYKFSPDWELLYARPMVDHTEGIATSWELMQDSINPLYSFYILCLSVDENDNMYVSGKLSLALSAGFGDTLHQYPVLLYWDSTHYFSMLDVTSIDRNGFIVKYDTGGKVQWCNQTFTRGDNQFSAYAGFTGVKVYDGSVYVIGQGGVFHEEQNGLVFFDDESHPLQRYQQSTSNQTFFVRYDAQTGYYLNQGVVPCIDAMCGGNITIVNNRVFVYADPLYVQKICQFTNDGEFINAIDFNTYEDKYPSVLANDQGRLIFYSSVTGPATFSNSVSANCPGGRSSAVFALYYDPSFAEPYVGIPDYEETLSNVRIWPNPTKNILYVESDNVPIDYITIMDLNGRILMKENVGDNSFVMNASCLSAGTYLLETVCKGERSVVKFVKVDD